MKSRYLLLTAAVIACLLISCGDTDKKLDEQTKKLDSISKKIDVLNNKLKPSVENPYFNDDPLKITNNSKTCNCVVTIEYVDNATGSPTGNPQNIPLNNAGSSGNDYSLTTNNQYYNIYVETVPIHKSGDQVIVTCNPKKILYVRYFNDTAPGNKTTKIANVTISDY